MNLSASQHVKTPPRRKRLFVKVQSTSREPPGKQKGGSLTPNTKGSFEMADL